MIQNMAVVYENIRIRGMTLLRLQRYAQGKDTRFWSQVQAVREPQPLK